MRDSSSTLAALIAVGRRYGMDLNPDELRRNFGLEEDEPDDRKVASVAGELGFQVKTLSLAWQELPQLQRVLPAILRLRDGTVLLLETVSRTKAGGQAAIVRDPRDSTDAQVAIDEAQLAQVWDGAVLLIKRRYAFGDEEKPFGLSWLVAQLVQERGLFRDLVITVFTNVLFMLAPVIVARIVLGKVLPGHSTDTLVALAIFFGILLVLELIVTFLRQRLLEALTVRLDGKLNLYIFDKLLKLPLEYFEHNTTGYIASKILQTQHIRHFMTGQLFTTLLDLITAVVLVPFLFVMSWLLAVSVMMWTVIVSLIVWAFLGPIAARHREAVAAQQERIAYMVESIYGMRTIKMLVLEARRRLGWDPRIARTLKAQFQLGMTSVRLQVLTLPFERLVSSGTFLIGAAMYLYYVALLSDPQARSLAIIGNQTTTGAALSAAIDPWTLVAFVLLAGRVASPLMHLGRLSLDLQEARGAVGQIASVVNVPPEETRSGTGMRLPIRGEVTFQDVRLRYSSDAPFALDGVSFSIRPGTILGIMGRSGSGKTTVTRLLQGLNQNYDGVIKVDGMDLREIDLQYLRTNIGVVAQENFLFTGTIRENIGMARSDASMAEVARAAQLAGAEEFIEKLPRGYNTMLTEGATNLSGGQRQRIAIARALILDPPVLILDEATSALDAESEAIINANLRRIAEGRTILCVSHRLSMLVDAHAIMVMEKGKLYDIGTHDELLRRCDIYKSMWYKQNRHLDPSGSHGTISVVHSA